MQQHAVNDKVILGLWPMAGITSGGVTEKDSLDTIRQALDVGIRSFDTAFSYGYDGESDRMLGMSVQGKREQVRIVGKAGQRWNAQRERIVDCTPETLTADAENSLRRMNVDHFDLFMLHAVDPNVDIRVSAKAVVDLQTRGLTKRIGVCNVNLDQLDAFCEVAKPDAVQAPLNMLQRGTLEHLVPRCIRLDIQVHVYWVLMKGILAGKIARDHRFSEGDSRPKYEIYQGDYRQRTHQLVDRLQEIAKQCQRNVAQLSIGWALAQPGITAAIIGAKRPSQIMETASSVALEAETLERVEAACDAFNSSSPDLHANG